MILRLLSAAWRGYLRRRDPIGYARRLGVQVGAGCRFIDIDGATFGSEPYLVRIGDHVTVTAGVRFVTHDGGVWVFRERDPDVDVFGPIRIGSNVFIGIGSIVLPGVEIGDDCIIGAGSVVSHSIPPGTVAAGVPARVVRTIEEYWTRVSPRVMRIRSWTEADRRRHLLKAFGVERQA